VVECIHNSPCFTSGKKFGECLRSQDKNEVPEQCAALRYTYFLCKRGQIDMRKRFKGVDPTIPDNEPSSK